MIYRLLIFKLSVKYPIISDKIGYPKKSEIKVVKFYIKASDGKNNIQFITPLMSYLIVIQKTPMQYFSNVFYIIYSSMVSTF